MTMRVKIVLIAGLRDWCLALERVQVLFNYIYHWFNAEASIMCEVKIFVNMV